MTTGPRWKILKLFLCLLTFVIPLCTNSLVFRKRSGSCRGKYNTAIYTQLDNICEDCYNLYKDPDVHHMCRADCFSTDFFRGCLEALMLQEQEFLEMVQIIG